MSCKLRKTHKAQLEMWVLTKIAMLFFIISLAFIAFNISNTEKSALCGEQALATARIIASNVNQVLASPVEDARVVYRFEPTIPISREKFGERYEVLLATHQNPGTDQVQLSIVVNPLSDATCKRRVALFYDSTKVSTRFFSNAIEIIPVNILGENTVKLTPSDKDPSKKTKYLVIVKCMKKTQPRTTTIYFDDCKNDDAGACSSFEPVAPYLTECAE